MKKLQEKKTGIISSSDLKTAKGQIVYWCMILVLVILSVTSLIPTFWALCSGFKESKEIYSGMSFLPKTISWEIIVTKVAEAARYMRFGRTSLNSLLQSIGSVVAAITVSGLGGYVISRLKPRGSRAVFMIIVWTMMMPSQIRTVPLFISYLSFPFVAELPGEVSLINTYWPMWLGAAASCFNVILFKNHFDSISNSLVEAAKIDGCGNGRIFTNIMLPMSGPIMMYVAIMTMKGAWSEFFTGYLVFNDEAVMTLPVQIYRLKSDTSIEMNTYMLCLVLSMIPMFILFTLFSRQIVGGVNVGGVKG